MKLNPWQGIHAEIKTDRTEERDIEGALSSGKTTVCLDAELDAVRDYPGIHCFWFRWSDTDTRTKLKPAVEELILARSDEMPTWDNTASCFNWSNGSRAYMFGLRAVSGELRYAKLRGLGVSRIFSDQSEELPADIAQELRARLRQRGFPHQITFCPNPVHQRHWLAKKDRGGFPEDNSVRGRKYFRVSLYDNAYNLPPETIQRLERTYPPEHPKHGIVILGVRGPNVIGDPVYEYAFRRKDHVRPITVPPGSELIEAFDLWKHYPTWVIGHRPYSGGLWLLAGIIGQDLFLAHFLDIVREQRELWFPDAASIRSCATNPDSAKEVNTRNSTMALLREAGLRCRVRQNGNSPEVILAMIERLAGHMRKRTVRNDEAFSVSADEMHWLLASREGMEPNPFMVEALESDYVWDKHMVSVGSKEIRQPMADDWAEHGINCALALEMNFGAERPTDQQRDLSGQRTRQGLSRPSQFPNGPNAWMVS